MDWLLGKRSLKVVWDLSVWLLAAVLVIWLRYDLELPGSMLRAIGLYVSVAIGLQLALGWVTQLYRGGFRTGSFDESLATVGVGVLTAALTTAVAILALRGTLFPRGALFLVPPVALLGMLGGRAVYRLTKVRVGPNRGHGAPTLIYGAGDAGYALLRLMQSSRPAEYQVVGFIDDAPSKARLRLRGVPVLGGGDHIAEIARARGVTTVILAIANADAPLVRRVENTTAEAGLTLKVMPHITELFGGRVRLQDVRDVDLDDILGRHQIDLDFTSIADVISGKRVLITGAGGSIGSELARRVQAFGPSELSLLDRDESALHQVSLSLYNTALLDTSDVVLCDIRDLAALRQVFERHRPQIVFHAAALKHLPMLEQYPDEGWKTNVVGTANVLRVASEVGVSHFVNVSTDKAANPTSVLGRTKRTAERLTAWYGQHHGGVYLSVRFGNVLGSRGSVLETFVRQIANGGPLTVVHPDITRYFMTIPEACQLIVQAMTIGTDGHVLVLDMGEPVRIVDVARNLIARSGKDIEIVFTGLRVGEKLDEELFSTQESPVATANRLISQVDVDALDPADLGPLAVPALPGTPLVAEPLS